MTTKHTPGPWRVDNHCDVAAQDRHVATPSLYGDGSDEANANLIAAAPDLLAACEMLIVAMNTASDDVERAVFIMEKAIAKAKGEDNGKA